MYLYVIHWFCRPQVPGAIAGSLLGEAAHRLVKNTLNIKTYNSSSGYSEQPTRQNFSGNYAVNRPRPAGPSGYQRGITEDPNSYNGHYNNFQGMMARPRFHPVSNGLQGERQNLRSQDRSQHLEQFRTLTIEGSARTRPPAAASPWLPTVMSSGMPNLGNSTEVSNQFVQSMAAPPTPPPKWINRAPGVNGGMYGRQQETSPYDKQVKKVYLAKTRSPHDASDSGNRSQDMSRSGNQH